MSNPNIQLPPGVSHPHGGEWASMFVRKEESGVLVFLAYAALTRFLVTLHAPDRCMDTKYEGDDLAAACTAFGADLSKFF